MTNQNMVIGCIATAVIAGGVGVYGGMTYQKSQVTSQFGQRMGGTRMEIDRDDARGGNRQNTGTGTGQGMMGRGGAIVGEITAKDDKSVTVKMVDGSSKIVVLSSDTTYRISNDTKLDEVTVGKTIAVQGTTNSDGSTTATSIELNPIARKLAN